MKNKKQIKKAMEAIKAKAVHCMTEEQWVDKDGNLYNIDRCPTDWAKVGKPRDTEVVL